MEARHCKYELEFKRPSGTSRGVLLSKQSHFIILKEGDRFGIGECGLLKGLSIDDVVGYEEKLSETCRSISMGLKALLGQLTSFPSIQFGLEQAFASLHAEDPFLLFPSSFTQGNLPIPINGLIWMGDETFLYEQLEERIASGFRCIKMKVGALNFDDEVRFLTTVREKYPADKIEIRLDANGAFDPIEALEKLTELSQFKIHSIEQPIAKGHWEIMKNICLKSSLPIALDEELIGVFGPHEKENLLQTIRPQYIILKPSLVGGIKGCQEWIELAQRYRIGWWVTSALESNVGLNAIAQWTATLGTKMYQGLGTGSLYTNNFNSPLEIREGMLYYSRGKQWPVNLIQDICS